MMAPIPWSDLLETLRSTPGRLTMLTEGVKHQDATRRARPDDWSVCQIVGHMAAIESPYRARLLRIALEDDPHVSAIKCITGEYDPDTPVSILIDTLASMRRETVAFLENLAPLVRGRTATHEELGPITLRSQVEALLSHDDEHLQQVAGLLQKD